MKKILLGLLAVLALASEAKADACSLGYMPAFPAAQAGKLCTNTSGPAYVSSGNVTIPTGTGGSKKVSIKLTTASDFLEVLDNSSTQIMTFIKSGNMVFPVSGQSVTVKSGGAGARAGTLTCNGATGVAVATTAASTSMAVAFALNTAAGSAATGSPYISAISNGVSFTVKCTASETSTYNWVMFNVG